MVRFEKCKLIVEVDCGSINPIEVFECLRGDLIELLQDTHPDMRSDKNYFYVLDFLNSLTPDLSGFKV